MHKIEKYTDEFALIVVQRGLQNGDPGILKHNSYRKNCRTFNKFLFFARDILYMGVFGNQWNSKKLE
jgi:hypothetical protein